jgi:catechol 2,3-dioxygenase-like lactoylglutathione lyase family enzyme
VRRSGFLRWLGLALALAGLALQAPASAAPSDGTVMRRTTLLVFDIERSIRFYEILGFTVWLNGPWGKVRGGGLPIEGVRKGDPSRLVLMKGKDPYIGMIGLLQQGPTRRAPRFRLERGDPVLMIEVRDIETIASKLREEGFRIHKPVETTHVKSVTDEWDAKFLFAIDPDGHMLELTERLN